MNIVILDTETGGLNPSVNPLISLAAITNGSKFSAIMVPAKGLNIDPKAIECNDLTPDKYRGKPSEKTVMLSFVKWLKSFEPYVIVGCNPAFDVGFVNAAFMRCGIDYKLSHRIMDIQSIAMFLDLTGKIRLPRKNGYLSASLDSILSVFGLKRSSSTHGAEEDVLLTKQVLLKLKEVI